MEAIMTWRSKVAMPGRYDKDVCDFLDANINKGRLSYIGTFWPTEALDEMCPYILTPLRVKKLIMQLPLSLSQFKTTHKYKSAMCTIHIYGYLLDIERSIIERDRFWSTKKRQWTTGTPENISHPNVKSSQN